MSIEMIDINTCHPDDFTKDGGPINNSLERKCILQTENKPMKCRKTTIIMRKIILCYINSKIRAYIGFTLFILIFTIIGIIIVCLTGLESEKICTRTFKRTIGSYTNYDSGPRSVAIGDFNNDTQLDFVVANTDTDNINVFFGYGNGTFKNQAKYLTGYQSSPQSIAVGNLNNDNILDIIVANFGSNNIGIFYGFKDGTFDIQKTFSTGSSRPLFIAIADINLDNQLDIVVVNHGTNSISIFTGLYNGSFILSASCFTGYDSYPRSLAIADLNNDNQLDIVVANSGTHNIGIFFGQGNVTFQHQKIYSTGYPSNPTSVIIADVNKDNQLDIIVTNCDASNIGVFLGYDNEKFSTQHKYSTGINTRPYHLSIGDFNVDNILDIITVDPYHGNIYILLGHDNGTFPLVTKYNTEVRSSPRSVTVGNFDNDNKPDALIVSDSTNSILALTGYKTEPTILYKTYSTVKLPNPRSLSIGDLNNDSWADFIIVSANTNNVGVFLGNRDETFSSSTIYSTGTGAEPFSAVLGDFNNDYMLDIAVVNHGHSNVGILLGYGNGSFSNISTYSTGINSSPNTVILGNLNNDNCLDIIVTDEKTNNIGVLLGYCNGSFAMVLTFPIGPNSSPHAIASEDFNKDNHLDIVVVNFNAMTIGIFLGCGNGTFLSVRTYSTGPSSAPEGVTVNDFNNDNNIDIVVTLAYLQSIGIFFGYGNGTFEKIKLYPLQSSLYPISLTSGDLNGDNRQDIAVTSYLTNNILILYGDNKGNFPAQEIHVVEPDSNPVAIKFQDFNNDKLLDIVVLNYGTNNFGILTSYYEASFLNVQNYSTGSGSHPFSLVVADFNNDNNLDIAVTNIAEDNVGIRLGYGNGTFGIETKYSTGIQSLPRYIILGDYNRDNQLDIVVGNTNTDNIIVLFGHNNGSFEKSISYSTGFQSAPRSIASCDLNNDKWIDLVLTNENSDNVAFLYGFNYTTFAPQQEYFMGNDSQPIAVCVSDFNNDNQSDVAVVDLLRNTINIYFGYGNGTFTEPTIYSIENNSEPNWISSEDFNNDHCQDIVIANKGSHNIGILFGYCNGTFSKITYYSTGNDSSPYSTAVGDLNNDNQLDIVVNNINTSDISIFLGYGNGSFSQMITYSINFKSELCAIDLGYLNNDNYLDIAVTDSINDNIYILIGYGNGSFAPMITYSAGLGCFPSSIILKDLNNDKQLDIVVTCRSTHNLAMFYGYGNGSYSNKEEYLTGPGSHPYDVIASDFNEDNQLDIAVLCTGNNAIVILFGLGNGEFLMGKKYFTDIGSVPSAMAIGYLNNDTRLDIVVASLLSHTISLFFGDDIEYFSVKSTISTGLGSKTCSIAIGDFNSDNRSDIVITNYETDNIAIILMNTKMNFSNIIVYSTGVGSHPNVVTVGDFNNDNYLDIAVANAGTNNVIIFRGYNNGKFTKSGSYFLTSGAHPYDIVVSNLNNDKWMDLAIVDIGTNNVFILFGFQNGTFGNTTSYSMDYDSRPVAIATGDFDNDNWTDIAVANFEASYIEILLKRC